MSCEHKLKEIHNMILDYEENHKGNLTKLGIVWKKIKELTE